MEKWPSTHVKLCDFGLSRVLTNQRLLEMSGTTDFLGKFFILISFNFSHFFISTRSC
jgi:serine/threonine protein kinase